MSDIHVKRGIEFRADLLEAKDRKPWLAEVGEQLEKRGITLRVGTGADAREVKSAAQLVAAFDVFQGAEASGAYVNDLAQALDDFVKPSSTVASGSIIDLTSGSKLGKALGLFDGTRGNYAALASTPFGEAMRTRPEGSLGIAGTRLFRGPAPLRPAARSAVPLADPAAFVGQVRQLVYGLVGDTDMDTAEAKTLLALLDNHGDAGAAEVQTVVAALCETMLFQTFHPGERKSVVGLNLLMDGLKQRCPGALDTAMFEDSAGTVRWDLFLQREAEDVDLGGEEVWQLDDPALLGRLNDTWAASAASSSPRCTDATVATTRSR